MTLSVSNSEVQQFKNCRRGWYLGYYIGWGIDPATSPMTSYAQLGTRVHAALEAWYGYDIHPVRVLDYIYRIDTEARPDCAEDLMKERAWATTMVEGFLEWAEETGLDEEHEVVATERIVSTQIGLANGESAIVKGKMDQLVRRRLDGALLFRDWKTVGTLHKVDALIRDEQFRTYSVLHHADFPDERVDGGLYTMLLRSKRTARAKGPFYEQVEIRYNATEHESMVIRLAGVLGDMHEVTRQLDLGADHRHVAYPHQGVHCTWCPFAAVCTLFDDGSRIDDAMHDNFVKKDPYGYYGDDLITSIKTNFGVEAA